MSQPSKRKLQLISGDLNFLQPKIPKTDWDKCVLCQEVTKESLVCPARSTRSDVGVGYASLWNDLKKFEEEDGLPKELNTRLSTYTENTFQENICKFHKTCRNKFDHLKLERLKSKKKKNADDNRGETSLTPCRATRSSFLVREVSSNCFSQSRI